MSPANPNQLQPQPPQDPQAGAPSWLRFQQSADSAKAEALLTHISMGVQKWLQNKNVVQTKTALEDHLLPLLGALIQLVSLNQIDMVLWAQRAITEAHRLATVEHTETIIGLDEDAAGDLSEPLMELREWLDDKRKLVEEDNDNFAVALAGITEHIAALDDVLNAIDDLTIEEDEEEEDEEDEEPVEPLAPHDEPPIHITDKQAALDAQPLVAE